MRVEDKNEKEEYELLYDQLSSYLQEKEVKEERTQKEHKYWVRMGTERIKKKRSDGPIGRRRNEVPTGGGTGEWI